MGGIFRRIPSFFVLTVAIRVGQVEDKTGFLSRELTGGHPGGQLLPGDRVHCPAQALDAASYISNASSASETWNSILTLLGELDADSDTVWQLLLAMGHFVHDISYFSTLFKLY